MLHVKTHKKVVWKNWRERHKVQTTAEDYNLQIFCFLIKASTSLRCCANVVFSFDKVLFVGLFVFVNMIILLFFCHDPPPHLLLFF